MAQQTAKEKAEELVKKFLTIEMTMYINDLPYMLLSKQCALIAVDEIIPIVNSYENALPALQQSNYLEYWYEVKKEIEKL
jgi:hypothetical protein